jgi:hypothetical protein
MQAPKIREKLTKLPRVPMIFSKINAVFQSTKSFFVGSELTESVPLYEITQEYRAHQLEVERLKAMAEEFAPNLRRRLI